MAPNRCADADRISDRLTAVVLRIHLAGDFLGFEACEELIGGVARQPFRERHFGIRGTNSA
jgi:hypothetical protein